MLKKIICALLSALVLTSVLASCSGEATDTSAETKADTASASDTATSADTQADEQIANVKALQVLDSVIAALTDMPSGKKYDSETSPLDALTFHSLFMEDKDITFSEDGSEIIFPPVMDKIADYAMFIANGKNPVTIDVFVVKNASDVDEVKLMCQDHINQIKGLMEGYDYDGILAAITANNGQTVYVKGNYVIMLSVLNPAAATAAVDSVLVK